MLHSCHGLMGTVIGNHIECALLALFELKLVELIYDFLSISWIKEKKKKKHYFHL